MREEQPGKESSHTTSGKALRACTVSLTRRTLARESWTAASSQEDPMKRGFAIPVVAVPAALFFGSSLRPAAARVTVKVMVDGVARRALVDPGLKATTTPSPLLFYFHGFGGSAELGASNRRFSAAWPEATIVYPQGLIYRDPNDGSMDDGWQFHPGQSDDRDVRFVDVLLKELSATYRVDERRVYATGFSNGAAFTYVLLTLRPEQFAAFAAVDIFPSPSLKWARVPRPVLIMHGKDDGIPLSFAGWARAQLRLLNGCGSTAAEWGPPPQSSSPGSVSYQPCVSGQPVIWSIHNGGHEWPPEGTATVLRFLKEQALPAPPPAPGIPVELDTSGTVAGSGRAGFSGDGGSAAAAQLFFPEGVALDRDGSLFIADTGNHRIRRMSLNGVIATVVGSAKSGFLMPPDREEIPAVRAQLAYPESIALDREGNLFIADTYNRLVRKVSANGAIRTVAGESELSFPTGLAVDSTGNLFVADTQNHRVRMVSADGTITTVVGTGNAGFAGDGSPAILAQLSAPRGLALDSQGNLFIADAANHRVRKVAPDGKIVTVAGTGSAGFSGDEGAAMGARLNQPLGVAVDSQGNFFIVDSLNHRVRRVAPDGTITTVFGGESGGDAGTAGGTGRYYPASVAVDQAGDLLIADPFNHRIWKVSGMAAPGLIAGQP
jgi:poly(3-hydroxybutyrate) depolymerase/sugar lactone lactonase YvrE